MMRSILTIVFSARFHQALTGHPANTPMLVALALFLPISLYAQVLPEDNSFLMTHTGNQRWLSIVKELPDSDQWQITARRFFRKHEHGVQRNDSARFYPMLVIDGVPLMIADSTNDAARAKLASLLTPDKISGVAILDKEPAGLYVNRAFTGVILVTLADRKVRKKFRRLMSDEWRPEK